MKKQIFRTLCIIIIGLMLINGKKDENTIDAKYIENSVAKISDNLYAGKYEVSNIMYQQFLNELEINNRTEDLKIAQIDSIGWMSDKQNYNQPLVTLYHKHPAYYNYPVVNISYEAANLFCAWLTEKYNAYPKRKFNKARFRLPTEVEWKFAAHGGHPNSVFSNGDTIRASKNGAMMYNFNAVKYFKLIGNTSQAQINENADILAPCKSYWANDYGLYNMSGNAAEMINDKGFAKGGSFLTGETSLRIDAIMYYQKSACDLGFRYFMDVVKMDVGNDFPTQKQIEK
jgi:formylglycine-generating enzyme required for sulfatase activity